MHVTWENNHVTTRIAAIVAGLILAYGVVSCGNSSISTASSEQPPTNEQTAENEGSDGGGSSETASIDNDGDGFAADIDCDDSDASINPGTDEVNGDGVNNDCDDYIDEYEFTIAAGKDQTDLETFIGTAPDGAIVQLVEAIADEALATDGVITISKSISLVGDVNDPPKIEGDGTFATVLTVDAGVDDVLIEGLDISAGTGDLISTPGPNANMTIRKSTIHGSTGDECVQLRQCTDCVMDSVTAYDCAQDGLNFSDGTNVTIRNCEIYNSGSENGAIYVYGNNGVTIENNSIHDCATDHAIDLYKNEGTAVVSDNEIYDIAFTAQKAGYLPGTAIFCYEHQTDDDVDITNNAIHDTDGEAFGLKREDDTLPYADPSVIIDGNDVSNNTGGIISTKVNPPANEQDCGFANNTFDNNGGDVDLDICNDDGNVFTP